MPPVADVLPNINGAVTKAEARCKCPARTIGELRQRLLFLNLALCVVAAGLWLGYVRGFPEFAHPGVTWWMLAIAFFVTRRWAGIGILDRGAAPITVGAAAFVVGLFYSTGPDLLAGYLIGALAAALTAGASAPGTQGASRRVLKFGEITFDLAAFAALTAVAEIVFRAVAGDASPLGVNAWLAALAASGIMVARRALVAVATGLHASALRLRRSPGDAVWSLISPVASTGLGLVAVVLIQRDPRALALLGVVALAIIGALHSLARERHQRLVAEFLYGAGDALGSRELESAIVALLHRARTMFKAEIAQLTIFPALPGEKAFRTTVREGQPDHVMEPLDLSQLDDVLEAETNGVIIDRSKSPFTSNQMLERRGIDEAMIALLRGESRILGSLLVGGHVDPHAYDAKDLQLFQTLVIQTATTLENGRLERSIARLTELQEQLTHQAFHDSLTDLANRSLFTDRVEHALQRSERSGRTVAILFLDVDDFKGVNDTHGHAAGDELLVGVAQRLRQCLRAPDTPARLGGDEFAVLLEDLDDPSEAELVARRTLESVRRPLQITGHTVHVRISIGVAVADNNGDNASNLMRRADVAMYAAKGAGKDRYVVFAPGMESDIVGRHRLRNDLDKALAGEEFILHYQPIVDLFTGDITGLEALVRWRHPTRGLVGPAEFIPLAEESGLILTLGQHVLRAACTQTLRLQARYPKPNTLVIAVNVSARQLQQPLFVESVLATVHEVGIRPESLVLELTESILLDDASSSIVKLEALQRAGIRIAIDDFGTGYSSLSYLRRLPVDILKIAKPFVDDLAVVDANGDFAQAIVGIASALRLSLIAEGIEAAAQVTRLRELGCTLGQGYYLCHPVTIEEIEQLLRRGGIERERVEPDSSATDQVIPLRARL
jgi:diguanylate cyclase (GGDEF)-like protein